jgi:hypothetical protein
VARGSAEWLSSRFARVRVRAAHRDYTLTDRRPEKWLLIEWPAGEDEPTRYWLSTLPKDITFGRFVDLTKLRWRIERDYQELKQGVGLGHFEGRGARLPPPRHAVHRGLRIPGLREGDHSLLSTSLRQAVQETCRSQRLPIQRLHLCDPNVTSPTQSRRCGDD